MLYTIQISQVALSDIGITGLDYNDLAIFNAIEYMHITENITKQLIKGVQYSLINWKLIKRQLPFLQHNTKQTIKKRIKKLEQAGLIEICPLNQELHSPYYKMGINYDAYKVRKEEGYVKSTTPISKKIDTPIKKDIAPISKKITNNNINYNNIIYNNKEEFFDYFWSLYPKKTDKKNCRTLFLKLSIEKMINAVEGIDHFTKDKKIEFVSSPTVYIRGERWEDEIIEKDNDDFFGGTMEVLQ